MLEELKSLNEKRSDLLWLIKVRSVDYLEKYEFESRLNRESQYRLKRISFKYYSLNDEELNKLFCVVSFRIDQLTSKISLNELSGIL